MKTFLRMLPGIFLLALLSACGGGGDGGGTPPPPPSGSNNWDTMVWDRDNWSGAAPVMNVFG